MKWSNFQVMRVIGKDRYGSSTEQGRITYVVQRGECWVMVTWFEWCMGHSCIHVNEQARKQVEHNFPYIFRKLSTLIIHQLHTTYHNNSLSSHYATQGLRSICLGKSPVIFSIGNDGIILFRTPIFLLQKIVERLKICWIVLDLFWTSFLLCYYTFGSIFSLPLCDFFS